MLIASYDAATKIDPATGEPAGIQGAIEGALWAIGTNKAFEGLSGGLQNIKAASSRGVVKRQAESRLKEYDFKTPEERFKAELKAAKTPSEKAAVEKKYAIQVEREKMHAEMEEAKRKAVNALRQGGDRAKVKENYNNDLKEINEKYAAKETRNKEHEEVMKELGFNANDIKHTGSPPKNAFSDVDLTPQGRTPHEAYQKAKAYVEAMRKRDHSINEYGDRWVDNTSDTTIWKPGFSADTPGSSSFEAEVIFGTLPHSDKFGTKGGIEWTSSATHLTDDPLGAVLANAGKAAGAGLGNNRPKDLHTIGKSAVKAAEAAGIKVEPKLKAQIEALKAHQTPEQADIYELGADKATQEKQTQAFLDKVQALMGQAFEVAKAKSEQNFKALEQQAKALGKSEEAYNLRAKIASYKAGNNAALTIIAQASPGLGKVMAKEISAVSGKEIVKPQETAAVNFGGLARQLFNDRESAAKAPALPAKANDPAFANIGKRCKEAAQLVQQKLAAAKPGSDEAKYLAELKSALEQGEKNPAEAIYRVRAISGTELAVVLAQLGIK